MDSKHRHELKTNELADWLGHLPEFCKRNLSTIIGAALIIIGLVTWPMFSRMREQRDIARSAAVTESIQNLDQQMFLVLQAAEQDPETRRQATESLLASAGDLLNQADDAATGDLAAMARIKAAQAMRTELHLRPEMIDLDELHERIDRAQQAYQKALDTATSPTLGAMARIGLALCAEERGQRDAAAQHYRDIIDTPDFAATMFPAKAQQRLEALDENLETFAFAPAPAPAADDEPLMPDLFSPDMFEADPSTVFQTPPAMDIPTPVEPEPLPQSVPDLLPEGNQAIE